MDILSDHYYALTQKGRPFFMKESKIIPGNWKFLLRAFAFSSALSLSTACLEGATLALYNFDASSLASQDADPDSSASVFIPSAGLGSTGNWNSTQTGVNTGAGSPAPEFAIKPLGGGTTTQAASFTNNAYLSFTLTPSGGFEADLSSLSFNLTVNNTGLRPSYYLSSSIGGFDNPIAGTLTTDITTGLKTFDLSDPAFQNLTTAVEFRLYLWSPNGGGSSGSRWGFDNITLDGTMSAVPEPSTCVLLLGGTFILGFLRLRQFRKA